MTLKTWAVVLLAGVALILTSVDSSAERKRPAFKNKETAQKIKNKLNRRDIGMVVFIKYDGTIETFATGDGELTVYQDPTDLPEGNLGSGKIEFVVDETNPKCIWCKHAGRTVKICR